MSWAAFRSSTKRYTKRPPANCAAARRAWDALKSDRGVESMGLLDGLWMARYVDGSTDCIDASLVTDRAEIRRLIQKRFEQGR